MRKNWHKKYTKRFLKSNKIIQSVIKNYLKKLYPGLNQWIKETFKEKITKRTQILSENRKKRQHIKLAYEVTITMISKHDNENAKTKIKDKSIPWTQKQSP